jgi:biotin carboxyl carrier protein
MYVLFVFLFYDNYIFIAAVLAVLSAMKMEMTIESPVDGVVKGVHVTNGMKVQAGDLIADIE